MVAKQKQRGDSESRHRSHYRERRRQVRILAALVAAGLVAVGVVILAGWTHTRWGLFLLWLGISAILGLVAYGLWRCPKCNRFLGFVADRSACPGCGLRFHD